MALFIISQHADVTCRRWCLRQSFCGFVFCGLCCASLSSAFNQVHHGLLTTVAAAVAKMGIGRFAGRNAKWSIWCQCGWCQWRCVANLTILTDPQPINMHADSFLPVSICLDQINVKTFTIFFFLLTFARSCRCCCCCGWWCWIQPRNTIPTRLGQMLKTMKSTFFLWYAGQIYNIVWRPNPD